MSPLVSIVVNCFNQAKYLTRSVESVLGQTFTDLECIIVDDGSTDNTRQVAEYLMQIDPRVRYCYKENGGLPSARNFGAQQAKGEWIQFLDSDDWIHEDKIRFQLNYFQGTAENIVFYSDYERVFIDADEKIVKRESNIIGKLTSEQLIKRLLVPDFLAGSPHPALQQAMLMHKSVFQKARFNENLKALGDRYFGVDILMKGAQFIYTPMIGAYYTKHQSNRTNSWKYMKNYYILFYETVYDNYPILREWCTTGLEFLVNEAIRDKEKDNFERLTSIMPMPLRLLDGKITINNIVLLRVAYGMRVITPSFLLYEKYRGPRSQKLLSIFSKRFGLK